MEENELETDMNSINDQEVIKQSNEQSEKSDKESEKPKKCGICSLTTILAIIAVIILIFCIVLVIVIIVYVRKESTRPPTPEEIIGAIICTYCIQNGNSEVEILSDDYHNINDISIVIDNKRIEFSKKYKFNRIGIHEINFYIDNNETMDYMFKNIISLTSVELFSEKNITVISMVGAFQDCVNLRQFINKGFNLEKVNSLNGLFLNNYQLMNISFGEFDTNNIIDMSQMSLQMQ